MTDEEPLWHRVRRRIGQVVTDGAFHYGARLGRLHPLARPSRHGVELIRDVAYRDSGLAEHRLDVYRPAGGKGPWPVVLYMHGGGFRFLSKESHYLMGIAFARRGYLVFNINYRLAPQYRFPAAVEDACAAYQWVLEHADEFGGDIGRLVLSGESAGGNLATTLAIAACYKRPEPFARAVWETRCVPSAVVPICAYLQISDQERFARRNLHWYLQDRCAEVAEAYLPNADTSDISIDLADPLVVLERAEKPERALPPFFAGVGTWDVLADDTRRLGEAIRRLGGMCEARFYEREFHAFHAMIWRQNARQCWRDTFAFLERHVGRAPQQQVAV